MIHVSKWKLTLTDELRLVISFEIPQDGTGVRIPLLRAYAGPNGWSVYDRDDRRLMGGDAISRVDAKAAALTYVRGMWIGGLLALNEVDK
jgi:hypothetical protein